MNNVLGVDIGGTRFRVGLFDEAGRRLLVSEGDTSRESGRDWMLDQILGHARELVEKTDRPVKACGASFGGPVDFARQRVVSVHTPGWQDFALGEWLERTLSLPCRVDNDANCGALGEHRFGAGRGSDSMVYITISTGIGAGIILGGQALRGRDNLAGELGHIPVSESGALCSCGAKGCLETFCSGNAIAERGKEWARRRPDSVGRVLEISGGSPDQITARSIVLAALEGDSVSRSIVQEAARWLGRALLTVIRILDPDRIVLGGGVAQAGSVLLDPVRDTLREFGSPSIGYSTEIVLAELENYSPLYGAAAMALDLAGKPETGSKS
jgi:glucokinase